MYTPSKPKRQSHQPPTTKKKKRCTSAREKRTNSIKPSVPHIPCIKTPNPPRPRRPFLYMPSKKRKSPKQNQNAPRIFSFADFDSDLIMTMEEKSLPKEMHVSNETDTQQANKQKRPRRCYRWMMQVIFSPLPSAAHVERGFSRLGLCCTILRPRNKERKKKP